VRTWTPAAWLITMRAFSPLAMQRSYNAVKSAAVMTGGVLGQVESSLRVFTSPLTMLANVGPGKAEGQGEGWVSWHPACPARLPASPEVGKTNNCVVAKNSMFYSVVLSKTLTSQICQKWVVLLLL
jgi:hypothetical protein